MKRGGGPELFAGAGAPSQARAGVVLPASGRRARIAKAAADPIHSFALAGRRIELRHSDYLALRAIAAGHMRVQDGRRQFRRLAKFGLVRVRWEQERDWPVPYVVPTDDGRAVLVIGWATDGVAATPDGGQ
jgi:hypothetical protein